MNFRLFHRRLALLLWLAVLSAALAEGGETAKGQAGETGGWRRLFNGASLEGWKTKGTAQWRAEDGAIVGGQDGDPKRSGLIFTAEEFENFEIEFEFIIDEFGKYNSGVYLRADPDDRTRGGYQVNIGRGAAEEYCGGLFTDRWLAKGDEFDKVRRKLDWNRLKILANGPHIEVVLNGVKVVDFTDPAPTEAMLKPGVIAFQTYGAEGHAGWVKFRNVRLRRL